eukprot:TRINITY_DN4316_c0_g1_i14.p1 TRINITY_DN4316_c0_g1~~TRINITY_DN4316_c0_g1_i14.p1  ORF type:complete len:223 (+),score=60.66 TRINITY_DN4316_c0_g1_i14:63-731(+)
MASERPTRAELKKYQRVKDEKEKADAPKNDLMVGPNKNPAPYIKRALILFNGDGKDEEAEKYETITIMGRGKTVGQVVQIAEIVKRRVKGLHQITRMENTTVKDHYKPKPSIEEELEDLYFTRVVGGLHITLSLKELDTKDAGYQPPLPESEVTDQEEDFKTRAPRRKSKKTQKPAGRGRSESGAGGRGSGGRGAGRGRGGTGAKASRGSGGRGGAARGRGQ